MFLKLITLIAVVGFLSACNKSSDSKPAAPAAKPAVTNADKDKIPVKNPPAPNTKKIEVKLLPEAGEEDKSKKTKTTTVDDNKTIKIEIPSKPTVVLLPEGQTTTQTRPTALAEKYLNASSDTLPLLVATQLKMNASAAQQDKNKKAAASITDVVSKIDASGDLIVGLEIQEGQIKKKYQLAGSIEQGQEKTRLSMGNAAGALKIKGEYRCMDTDARMCQVAIMYLQIGEGAAAAQAAVIFRSTHANYKFDAPSAKALENAGLAKMNRILADYTVRNITVESVEVIGGKSSVRVTLLDRDGEVIGLSGALTENAKLNKAIRHDSISSLIALENIKTNIQKSITSAQLLKVEQGKIFTLSLNFNTTQQDKNSNLVIRIERVHAQTKPL